MITNRDGELEPLRIQEIQKKTSRAVEGLKGVSQSELEVDAQIQFRDGMPTSDIQKTLWKTALDKIDIDVPNWTFVASRLYLDDLYHMAGKTLQTEKGPKYGPLNTYMSYGEKCKRIMPGLKDMYFLEELDQYIVPERDKQFNILGIITLTDRYLLKNQNDELFELPQHMFMGIAMFLAHKEKNISSLSKEEQEAIKLKCSSDEDIQKAVRTAWAKKFYDMISKFEVMLATPTLSNARTLRNQMSSCYVNAASDNIEGIFDTYKEHALLSKYGGGIGCDWMDVRGQSSYIAGHKAAAGGTVPFLKIENDVAIAVDQLGTRKGSIAVFLEPWHIDIKDFLDLKKNSGEERRRAHDLFPALWIPDLFMERAEKNESWTLFSPNDVPDLHTLYGEAYERKYVEYENNPDIHKEVINAKDLWKKILVSYFETGTPFLDFKDTANRANPNGHVGVIRSSNLCQEIFQNTSPNTYKTKIKYVDGTFDIFDENEVITLDNGVQKLAKHIITIDTLNGKDIYFIGKETIEGETAVCNLASVNLSKIHTKEDLERIVPVAMRALDIVIDMNFYPTEKAKATNLASRSVGLGMMGEAEMLACMGITYGTQAHFEKIDEIMEVLSYNAIKASALLGQEKGSYPNFEGSNWSKGIMPFDHATAAAKALTNREESEDWFALRKLTSKAMRNGYLMAIAPTGSISILVGTTATTEAVYKRKFNEKNLSGLIPVVAPKLSPETWAHYVPAFELDQRVIVKAGAIRQKWVDQGQSLNLFFTLDKASGKELNEVYVLAWKLGLKSTYYLRSESPEAKVETSTMDRSTECMGCQ
jgi:ribonucleoside-diphosphate reductase alpha chain